MHKKGRKDQQDVMLNEHKMNINKPRMKVTWPVFLPDFCFYFSTKSRRPNLITDYGRESLRSHGRFLFILCLFLHLPWFLSNLFFSNQRSFYVHSLLILCTSIFILRQITFTLPSFHVHLKLIQSIFVFVEDFVRKSVMCVRVTECLIYY